MVNQSRGKINDDEDVLQKTQRVAADSQKRNLETGRIQKEQDRHHQLMVPAIKEIKDKTKMRRDQSWGKCGYRSTIETTARVGRRDKKANSENSERKIFHLQDGSAYIMLLPECAAAPA